MVLAARTGNDRLAEAQRRLGMMRIATKYPRIAERYFESTGRQIELVEVKGSVELAPLVGLADGIVDLVATGRTLEENELEVREEIVECTARFVANRVAHKLRATEIDELTAKLREASGGMRTRRFEWEGAAQTAGNAARLGEPRSAPDVDVVPIEREVRAEGDAAVLRLTNRFDAGELHSTALRVGSRRGRRGSGRAGAGAAGGDGSRDRQHPPRRRGSDRRGAHGRAPRRPEREAARGAGRRRRDLRPRRARRLSLFAS